MALQKKKKKRFLIPEQSILCPSYLGGKKSIGDCAGVTEGPGLHSAGKNWSSTPPGMVTSHLLWPLHDAE